MAEPQWTPPPAQQSNWQEPSGRAAHSFQAPPPAAGGENQDTGHYFAGYGHFRLLCCSFVVTGPSRPSLPGFMGMKKGQQRPGGLRRAKGLAIAGNDLGGVFFLLLAASTGLHVIFVFGLIVWPLVMRVLIDAFSASL